MKVMGNKSIYKYIILGFLEVCVILTVLLWAVQDENFMLEFYGADIASNVNPLVLERGSYSIEIDYETDLDNAVCYTMMTSVYGPEQGEKVFLEKEGRKKISEIMLWNGVGGFQLVFEPGEGDGELQVEAVIIRRTEKIKHVVAFWVIMLILLADVAIYMRKMHLWMLMSATKRRTILLLLFGALIPSAPLFVNYITYSHDLNFHLMRIEGMAQALANGQFPVRVQPGWLNDYGYPVSVMYGDILLYFPAVLRFIGFPLQTAYKMYVGLLNVLTMWIGYYCVKEVSESENAGIIGGFLYVMSSSRMTSIYVRGALGEFTAFTFYPLIFLGLYYAWKKENKKAFPMLVLGYTFILQSHLLSFEMMIVFSVIYALLHLRELWKNRKFILKTALLTVAINLVFLVPMLDYLVSYQLKVENANIYNMQENGIFLSQLSQMFFFANGSGSVLNGVLSDMSIGIGMPYVLVFAFFIILLLAYGEKIKETDIDLNAQKKVGVLFLIAIVMSCYFFPWNVIKNIPVIGMWLTPYQFAYRFVGMADGCGILILGFVVKDAKNLIQYPVRAAIGVGLCVVILVCGQYIMDHEIGTKATMKIVSGSAFDSVDAASNQEYLFEETDAKQLKCSEQKEDAGIVVEKFEKQQGRMTVTCKNTLQKERKITFPLLNYKKYVAKDRSTGRYLEITNTPEHILQVVIPEKYEGEFEVYYTEPVYWRLSEILSVFAVLYFLWKWRKLYEKAA